MTIIIGGLFLQFPQEQCSKQYHCHIECYLPEKSATQFMAVLRSTTERAHPDTLELINNVTFTTARTRLDVTLTPEEAMLLPPHVHARVPLNENRLSRILYVGDELQFNKALLSFVIKYGSPENVA